MQKTLINFYSIQYFLPFPTEDGFGNMHLQISLLLLFCLNIVHGSDGYFSERYQKQSSIKGPPHFLPFNVKSQGKSTIFFFFNKLI